MASEQFETIEELVNNPKFIHWVRQGKHNLFWKQWRRDNPDKEELLNNARFYLEQLSFQAPKVEQAEIEEALQGVWNSIEAGETVGGEFKRQKASRRLFLTYPWRIAAAILFLMAASWIGWQFMSSPFQVYKTAYGETKAVTLPDGSSVMLQANSTLKVAKDWEKEDSRLTQLEGEAFFTVEKSQGKFPVKFVVATDDYKVEVLGTQFNVLNRQAEQRIVLVEGKIQLRTEQEDIVLAPNEMVQLSSATKKYEKTTVQIAEHTAWAQGQLLLNNTPLIEMARMLRDNYGFEVRFSEDVDQNQKRTSVGLLPIQSPNELMDYIAAIYEVALQKEGQVIYCSKLN
ncbi:MAG: FecR domain-containing protein [Saprospiraceae bacterium]|nr:FecR domain-containing protein [Saprospiraceae bacterium]